MPRQTFEKGEIMADLRTRYLGLELRNPIIVGSSGLTNSLDKVKAVDDCGAGAVVLKSIFEEQILFETNKLLKDSDVNVHPEAFNYLTAMSRDHSIGEYLELVEQTKEAVSIPVIASINCLTAGEWTTFAGRIEAAGADALELNVFVTDYWVNDSAQIEDVYFKIIRKVMGQISIPIALKISTLFSNLPKMLIKLSGTGISGLVLFNRYWSPDIDLENMRIEPGNAFSSPDEITIPLRWIGLVADLVSCDISGTTGVHDGNGAIKLILAGATTVQVCSALYKNGVEYISTILDQIETWMAHRGYGHIDEIRGKLMAKTDEDRENLGRTQFMKYYAGWE